MRFIGSKKSRWIAAVLLILALFFVRPGAQGLRSRIVRSISMALGRQVDVGSVSLRLLPQPGFELQNFVVHDAPQFGAEPMLRAQEVSAVLRIASLVRGRMEVARLSFSEPSLNLVRNGEGHWNLEDVLERAARMPVAPTAKAKTELRPAFPYIEADGGRINVKLGQEKTPYALIDADFALWQDTEDIWSGRLEARPVRTDFNLTDTGLLKIQGSWRRAASLRETPLRFTAQWDRAQLGQVTKLVYGNDKGWRGAVRLLVTANGTPAQLMLKTDTSVEDFRRYDISPRSPLRLAAHCKGQYSSLDHAFSDLSCRAPVGNGEVSMEGSLSISSPPRLYDLAIRSQAVPLQSLVQLALHISKRMNADLDAKGSLDGSLMLTRSTTGELPDIAGDGEISDLRLATSGNQELVIGRIPLRVNSSVPDANSKDPHLRNNAVTASALPTLEIGPFDVPLGRPLQATARGRISRAGYGFEVEGEAELARLLNTARALGLFNFQITPKGLAKVDLKLASQWQGSVPRRVLGTVHVRSVRAEVPGLNAPLEIASANVTLAENEIKIQKISASLVDNAVSGSIVLARPCVTLAKCSARFDLHADEIASDRLRLLLTDTRPWYSFLSSSSRQAGLAYLAALHAAGRFTVARLSLPKIEATRLSATLELENRKLRLSNLRGEVLDGIHTGDWNIDFTGKGPVYKGQGTFERVSLEEIATVTGSNWITGTAAALYNVTASGSSTAELLSSAAGSVQLEARDGSLPHLVLASASNPLVVNRFVGEFLLRNGSFEIQQGKLETPAGIYLLSGTASLKRSLDLKLMRDSMHGFNITGTLPELQVQPLTLTETQAALNP